MLLADDKGASLIVAVGTHVTLVEFLDKGRAGMASTFLTRLRVGGKLVDAKGVSRLYRSRISTWQLVLLLARGLLHSSPPWPRQRRAAASSTWSSPGGTTWCSGSPGQSRPVQHGKRTDRNVIDFRYHVVSIVAVVWPSRWDRARWGP